MKSLGVVFRFFTRTALALFLGVSLSTTNLHAACNGDVNSDSAVDIRDALFTLRYVVDLIPHTPENEAKYKATVDVYPLDANKMPLGDGNINISDALTILKRSVNLLTWDIMPPGDDATITDLPGPGVTMAAGALGSVTFTVDAASTGSLAYPADGQPASLTVTDASGLVWRLDVPGDALVQPVAIKMTALKDLSSAALPGSVTGGVLLEPDGLRFLTPATLTVTPPAGGKAGLILVGRHDGTGIELAPSTIEQDSLSAQIFHFSMASSTSSDDSTMNKLKQNALADFASAKAAAQELLKQGVTVPPPPDAKLHCMGTSAYQDPEAAIAAYEKQVASPEEDVRNRLIGTAKALALLGEQTASDEALKLAQDVQARVVKKTGTLVKTYSPQPDKFLAVSRVALNAERNNQLLGGPDNSATMTTLATWAGTFLDHYIDELKVRHDYRVMPALYEVARIAALLGAANADNAIDRILAASTFTAYFDTAMSMAGEAANTLQWHLNGNVTIDKTAEQAEAWEGTDNGKYLDFTTTDGKTWMTLPNSFPVTVKIEKLDACEENIAQLTVSAIGADMEMYNTSKGSAPASPGMIESMALLMLNEQYDQVNSLYRFKMPLTNQDQEAAREIYTNSYGQASFQYDLKLHHDPK